MKYSLCRVLGNKPNQQEPLDAAREVRAANVLRARESLVHGEGRQVTLSYFEGTSMKQIKFSEKMKTKLNSISKGSLQEPDSSFHWLIQHFNVENLEACFHSLDGKKAVGIDQVTKEEYGTDLKANLNHLVDRMKKFQYRPQPNRVVHIPKSSGGQRKLAIGSVEDKIVQTMFSKILEAIYEPAFMDCSFAFRPKTGCHAAIVRINSFLFSHYHPAIYEIDFADFFGSIDHKKLIAILKLRIKDEVFLRYVSRMLKAGELRNGNNVRNKVGLPQGNIASPVLANIFAHYAIDRWFQPANGEIGINGGEMVRFCDDAVFLFKSKADAVKFEKLFRQRIERFGLVLNESKCQLLTLNKKAYQKGAKQPTFSFLGFTFFLGKTKKGRVVPKLKTDAKGMRKKLKEIKSWLSWSRNKLSMMETWNHLRVVLRGYRNYFGISYNMAHVQKFTHRVILMFFKALNRRSQKKSINWTNFLQFLKQYAIPYVPVKRLLF